MYVRKIISIVVWVVLSALFFYLVEDTGRSIGAKTESQYEEYCDYKTDRLDNIKINYTDLSNYDELVEPKVNPSAEEIGSSIGEAFSNAMMYSRYDIDKEFQSAFKYISAFIIIYVFASMVCFYFFITNPKKSE